jgi:hypothetical protein
MTKQFRSFESAREFVRSLGLKGQKEWKEYCKSGNKPEDIPVNFDQVYKKEYNGSGDLLGTGFVAAKNRKYRSFKESRNFVRSLNLKNHKDWIVYCTSGNKPDNIPSSPINVYKKEYADLGDWLGTGRLSTRTKKYLSFDEAREFARQLGFKKINEWRTYCKSGNKPYNIPADPWKTYKNQGWVEVGDWLGSGRTRHYRPFKEAREFVRSLGLKGVKEWYDYCKSGKKPDDIPSNPWNTYKEWNILRRSQKK